MSLLVYKKPKPKPINYKKQTNKNKPHFVTLALSLNLSGPQIPLPLRSGVSVVVHTCIPVIPEAESGAFQVQGSQ